MTIDDLLTKWLGKKGAGERAEYQQFLTEFAWALGVPSPGDPGHAIEDYRFEAPVRSEAVFGGTGTKRIDLYKRGCFILEAKQSRLSPGEAAPAEPAAPAPETVYDLFGAPVGLRPAAKPAPRYDRLMADARLQAERYALALPEEHRAPPFLLVVDIGRGFELYFDWSGTGHGYRFFPDQQSYRIALQDLVSPARIGATGLAAADLLRAIWRDPASVDPRLKAAEVTRDIAVRLSRVAAHLEENARSGRADDVNLALGIEETSLFLMRVLFCMFAEDVELLPRDSFKRFLADAKERSDQFWRSGLDDLWRRMNERDELNRYWPFGDAIVRYFNGNLFAAAKVFDLPLEFKGELLVAAGKDWRAVEPAIFGTLLEQVLTSADRARLGAHYTPRAYVERLVAATILDVLEPEWTGARDDARAAHDRGDDDAALGVLAAFHDRLADTRVLDPACGTGNFLYVAMEQLLRLEGEVIQLSIEFADGPGRPLRPRVHPNQFLGLELNPRAAVIAELVLWIGWLRHRLANHPDAIGDPVLPTLTNINGGMHGGYDAVLARTPTGQPDVDNPRRPPWPEADFIVGNPPFIGKGAGMREHLGDEYLKALWRANPHVPASADFVMQWWDRAADILTRPATRLRRFGFVTTNSITQVFSRRVIERHLTPLSSPSSARGGGPPQAVEGPPATGAAPASPVTPGSTRGPASSQAPGNSGTPDQVRGDEKKALSLVFAIPDHPWYAQPRVEGHRPRAEKGPAAVRIAMTVAKAGEHEGRLVEIVDEGALDTDKPKLETREMLGRINADLTVGSDVTSVQPLNANYGMSNTGMLLAGQGFAINEGVAQALRTEYGEQADSVIRPYVGGAELVGRSQNRYAIDFNGLSEKDARNRFPTIYSYALKHVKPERDQNPQKSRRDRWWLFGRSNAELRAAMSGLKRLIVTTRTAKHRVFQFVDGGVLPNHEVVAVASDDPFHLGVLSSRIHSRWAFHTGGTLEDRPRYNKASVFDPFPFPDPIPAQRAAIAGIAEELDDTRRRALAEDDALTMTGLYNLVAAVRDGTLAPEQEARATRARARIVAKLHDDLDQAVADAYGWGEDWRAAPLPPADIVARLVALNAERAAEEAAGTVRWLRPEYQIGRSGKGKRKNEDSPP